MPNNNDLKGRVVIDPRVLTGKPIIKGTRIPVELILKKLGQKIDMKEILADFPRLKEKDIQAAILYAESLVEGTEVFPLMPAE